MARYKDYRIDLILLQPNISEIGFSRPDKIVPVLSQRQLTILSIQ
jgi:hypothetical protein